MSQRWGVHLCVRWHSGINTERAKGSVGEDSSTKFGDWGSQRGGSRQVNTGLPLLFTGDLITLYSKCKIRVGGKLYCGHVLIGRE